MTVAYRDGEGWLVSDGAPDGPSFDFVVPSHRHAGPSEYRIVRDQATGLIVHRPACLAWSKGGPCVCGHLKVAIAQAEQPAVAFLSTCRDKIAHSAYWANPEEAIRILGEVKVAMEEAEAQIRRNADEARVLAESAAFRARPLAERAEDAVREFGGVQ